MATADNLQAAFAGESQANRKYLAFAQKADAEGYPQIAKLFRAAAAAETVHALQHFKVMGGVKNTAANLQASIDGEGYEFREMYPSFLAEAGTNNPAQMTFKNAMAVEKIHHDLYSQAFASLTQQKDLPARDVYVCEVCGNTVYGQAPDTCPICGVPGTRFKKVE
jgi:rubrerythrin